MARFSSFLLAAACGLPLAASAGDDDTMTSDRPDVVESSRVVGKGRLQLETSLQWERDRADGATVRTLTTPTLLRIGLGESMELRFETDGRTIEHAGGATLAGYADTSVGIIVAARVPGFCGYRMLEDGDVVLRLTSDRPYDFHNPAEFSSTVARQRAGDTVTFDVLRRGKLLHVPITLDRKPAWADPLLISEAMIARQRRAADYWDQAFAPLVEGHTS